jgi:hypothetical protein
MTESVHTLYRQRASKAERETDAFSIIVLFCAAGLLVSLIFVAYGFDLGLDFY